MVFPEFGTIALVVIFGKTEKDNLTKADCRVIARMIESYRIELESEFRRGQRSEVNRKGGGSNGKAGR